MLDVPRKLSCVEGLVLGAAVFSNGPDDAIMESLPS